MKVRCLAVGVCDSHTPHGQLPVTSCRFGNLQQNSQTPPCTHFPLSLWHRGPWSLHRGLTVFPLIQDAVIREHPGQIVEGCGAVRFTTAREVQKSGAVPSTHMEVMKPSQLDISVKEGISDKTNKDVFDGIKEICYGQWKLWAFFFFQ